MLIQVLISVTHSICVFNTELCNCSVCVFICVCVPAEQLAYSNPHVYNCSLPAPLMADLTRLAQLCLQASPPVPRDRSVKKLRSAQGESFLSFVKTHLFVDGRRTHMSAWGELCIIRGHHVVQLLCLPLPCESAVDIENDGYE